ncbi:MAG: (2Fe-2S)-binding protein [Acidimicrobiia bacterium]
MTVLQINGEAREVTLHGSESLLFALRERLGLPGSKDACEQGECGACTVLMDGQPVCSCLVMAADAEGSEIITIEGLSKAGLHPVQQAFLEEGAVQCGFCTPGFVVAAAELFDRINSPSEREIREALAGNICRCTGYGAILRGLSRLAESS